MMSFECFEMLMNSARAFWNKMIELENFFNVQFDDNWMTNHFDDIVDAITTEFEGPEVEDIDEKIGPIIMYWMFDMNWGEEKNKMIHKDIEYTINNLEDLYTVLKALKDYREGFLD